MSWKRILGLVLLLIYLPVTAYWGYNWYRQSSTVEKSVEKVMAVPNLPDAQSGEEEVKTTGAVYKNRPQVDQQVGTIHLPRLNRKLPIYEGSDAKQLKQGVGHYRGSVLPGEADNTVLAGHRETVFKGLGEMEKGDTIKVETEAGEFVYEVTRIRIVDENDKTVIVSTYPKPELRLVTCYPFTPFGPAPERFIVEGELKREGGAK
ncbi:class D sortase [Kroppenstedtia pulmonis]|uniref:Class D sortase n=1 Tax=Kroppenstedtia pulmonis TaxID=1380685 RepID=A0A7D3XZX1_9BACL|nr:class D sortase [Kroppenstedtia pulmonis]QKG83363.1 class D sortase [Kroppenstedtia pulmonis]